jgi:hypothetical protein
MKELVDKAGSLDYEYTPLQNITLLKRPHRSKKKPKEKEELRINYSLVKMQVEQKFSIALKLTFYQQVNFLYQKQA